MSFWRKHSLATLGSIVIHAGIVAAVIVGIRFSPGPRAAVRTGPIEAVVVDEAAIQREMDRIEADEQAEIARREEQERRAREAAEAARLEREREQQRLEQIQAEREAAEQAERDRVAALERQRERDEAERVRLETEAAAERQRLETLRIQREEEERIARERAAEAERQRQEAARRQREEEERIARERAAEEERRRREAEAIAAKERELEQQLSAALAAEEEARAAQEAGLLDEYIRSIENQIQQRWIRPPSAGAGLECVVNVTQIISGDVTSVSIGRCNGDDAVIRSIEAAVYRASPLPRPPVPSLFNRNLVITFKPDS